MNEPDTALPTGLRAEVVNRIAVRCEDEQCRLVVASEGACRFVAEAATRAEMVSLAAEHVALWHPGPDLCVTGDCTDLAVEPGSRFLVVGDNWPRACVAHSRIRYHARNERFEERLFCRTRGCGTEAVVTIWTGYTSKLRCSRCASYTPGGRRALERCGIALPDVIEATEGS